MALLISTVSMVIFFVILEVAARTVLMRGDDPDRFLRYASLQQIQDHPEKAAEYFKYQPHYYLGYTPTPNYRANNNQHNTLGFRDDEIELPKPPGEFRVVCVGGSTTYTPAVGDYRYSYPNVVEQELQERGYDHVNVINGGVDGWTSHETLISFTMRLLELDPDLIIVHHSINDVFARIVWPSAAFRPDNSGHRERTLSQTFMPGLLEHSTLIRGLLIRMGKVQSHASSSVGLDLKSADTFRGFEYERQQTVGSYPQDVFVEADLAHMLEQNTSENFATNIEHFVVLAKSHDIDVLLSNVAIVASDPSADSRPLVESPEFIQACNAAGETMRAIANRHNIHYFDFNAAFPKQDQYFRDGIHMTFEGAKAKGALFADHLIDKEIIAAR
jgi:lysophospholipase L1-like esterase